MSIISTFEAPVRTGMSVLHSGGARQRKSVQCKRVPDPGLSDYAKKYARTTEMVRTPPFDFNVINNMYLVESYVRQGVDKYVELILKEGWGLKGGTEQVAYLHKRFKLMGLMSDPAEPFDLVIERSVRDYIKFGNFFLVSKRVSGPDAIPGLTLYPLKGKSPIGAYFNLPVKGLKPKVNPDGKVVSWVQSIQSLEKEFPLSDIIHCTYCKDAGAIWGMPPLLSVVEDARALRQVEESVLKLIYRHLNPTIHHELPDVVGDGQGRVEDMDDAVRMHQYMADNGIIITPPGHKIKVMGAESQAIRAEGYIDKFKGRVFSGLSMSPLTMGEGANGGMGTAESLTLQMHNTAKMYQYLLSLYFTAYIINELLMEGGYDPWGTEEDVVTWVWQEIEVEKQIKLGTHALNLYTMNAMTLTECREKLGLDPNVDLNDLYVHQVQIPQLIASRIAMDPLDLGDDELKKMMVAAQDTKNKSPNKSVGDQGGDAGPGSNQHTPKVSPNAPTAHKMMADIDVFTEKCEKILALIPMIQKDEAKVSDIETILKPLPFSQELSVTIYNDIKMLSETQAYLRVNARLTNERALILSFLETSHDKNT